MSNELYKQEVTYLGALINAPELIPRAVEKMAGHDWVSPEVEKAFRWLIDASQSNYEISADLLLSSDLPATIKADLLTEAPVTQNIGYFENLILKRDKVKNITALLKEAANKLRLGELPEMDTAQKFVGLLEDNDKRRSVFRGGEAMEAALLQFERTLEGNDSDSFRFGFKNFDNLTNGFRPSELNIIAARPGVGKTAFALNLAIKAALKGKNVVFFSLEMSEKSMMLRALSMLSGVSGGIIKNPRSVDPDIVDQAADKISEAASKHFSLFQNHLRLITSLESIEVLRVKLRSLEAEGFKPDFLFIDYLGLLSTSQKMQSREREISYFTGTLKQLALRDNICVVALSQLNRDIEKRTNPVPHLADLRDSGSVEQDADRVIMLFDEYASQTPSNPVENENLYRIFVRKNREGALGDVPFNFYKNTMRFREID